MPTCNCPGSCETARMQGFTGSGRGQTKKIARGQAYRNSGLTEAYYLLMRLAFEWECDGRCEKRTRYKITGNIDYREDKERGIWHASFEDLALRVWVECAEPVEG